MLPWSAVGKVTAKDYRRKSRFFLAYAAWSTRSSSTTAPGSSS